MALKNQYLIDLLETVKKRNAGEPEFIQAVTEVFTSPETESRLWGALISSPTPVYVNVLCILAARTSCCFTRSQYFVLPSKTVILKLYSSGILI